MCVFPAQAGVILANGRWEISGTSIPRASGGDPSDTYEPGYKDAVFPAQAGVIPSCSISYFAILGIPRASGGDPLLHARYRARLLYSPRKRG